MVLEDNYRRPLLNLRVATTRRCNLRCSYCHGEGETRHEDDSATEMTVNEIVRLVRIAVALGISRIKLTGGEPLMRKDILDIVKGIASVRGLADLSMTTNGTMLAHLAEQLHTNGLKRVNISLSTLNGEVYHKLTGGNVEHALEGVKAAVDAGFNPVKLNMLVLKGVNEDTVPEMIDFARQAGTVLQLIELEPLNVSDAYYSTHHTPLDDFEDMLRQKAVHVETRRFMQNRRIYRLPDATVETVHPVENSDFCKHCTRLRVTSDGKLKPCLMRNDNVVAAIEHLRNGADDKEIAKLFEAANAQRQPYHTS